jgi:hypothetical protein
MAAAEPLPLVSDFENWNMIPSLLFVSEDLLLRFSRQSPQLAAAEK